MRSHIVAVTLVVMLLTATTSSLCAGNPSDSVELIQNRQEMTSHLRVATPAGKVSCGDLFRGISRLYGYDDTELKDALPETCFSLDGKFARWCHTAFNWLLSPCVRCDIQRVSGKAKSMELTVDRAAAQQSVHEIKGYIRSVCGKIDLRRERPGYGIELPRGPIQSRPIVVLVHGLNSRPEDLHALIKIVQAASLTPATFRYPNDQPIAASAKLLSAELKTLKLQYPTSQVRLVTHSMGGLVARAAIEPRELDPGNVSQLVMIAPPNQGSTLARVAAVLDCYEYFTSSQRRGAGLMTESVADGLGEATADLEPQSVFLDRLNAQPRNPRVRYTILLGTQGPLQPAEANALGRSVRSFTDGAAYVRFAASKINHALDDLDEVVNGQGDGVVSVKRGRLAGVDDVVTLPFSHNSVLDGRRDSSRAAHRILHQRLRAP